MRDQEHSPAPGSRPEAGWPPEHWSQDTFVGGRSRSDSATSSKGGAGASDAESPPPTVTSPGLSSPFFVSGATSSASTPSAYRDAPTGKQNVFEAITKRDWAGEKHRVNSIVRAVGSLAKGNDPVGALGPARQRSRQYTSKLKREAELAGASLSSSSPHLLDSPEADGRTSCRSRLPLGHLPARDAAAAEDARADLGAREPARVRPRPRLEPQVGVRGSGRRADGSGSRAGCCASSLSPPHSLLLALSELTQGHPPADRRARQARGRQDRRRAGREHLLHHGSGPEPSRPARLLCVPLPLLRLALSQ